MWRQTVPGMSSNNQEYLVIDDGKSRVRWTIGDDEAADHR